MRRLLIFALALMALSACNAPPDASPSPPTREAVITPTPTPQPAPTLFPTLSLTPTLAVGWKTLTSTAGGFSISMPNMPSEQVQAADSSLGHVQLHMFMDNKGSAAYLVGYADYPAGAVSQARVTDLLSNAVNGAVTNVSGKLISRTFGSLDGVPGVEFSGEIPPNSQRSITGVMQGRMFFRGNRLYQIIVVMTQGQEEQAQGYLFLDSFRFLGQ
ncbi:MAG: hypothetical protein WCF84_23280 [Anaerolineae bacterium]